MKPPPDAPQDRNPGQPSDEAWRLADEREELHARKRRLILETAARAFARNGYHQTSIDRIASLLQVTKPTIYYYVKNKDEILFQIVQTALDDLDRKIAESQTDDFTARQRLKLFFWIYGRIINSDFGNCMALVSDNVLKPATRAELRRYKKEFELRVRRIIEAGLDDGTIPVKDPRLFTFALFGAFNWMPQWYSDDGRTNLDEIVEYFIEIFCPD
ncbi:TetR/AcrR family transcriptional regulator [Oceanibacterium hippocampi]|nr:TetR/AcrR family transcriptional regulator [Oceanibacterium hippocampi]